MWPGSVRRRVPVPAVSRQPCESPTAMALTSGTGATRIPPHERDTAPGADGDDLAMAPATASCSVRSTAAPPVSRCGRSRSQARSQGAGGGQGRQAGGRHGTQQAMACDGMAIGDGDRDGAMERASGGVMASVSVRGWVDDWVGDFVGWLLLVCWVHWYPDSTGLCQSRPIPAGCPWVCHFPESPGSPSVGWRRMGW
jgi:hypothetical protein